jgi:hypothetical protein
LEVRLRVGHRSIVDERADLLQTEVQQRASLEVADVLLQVLLEVTLDGDVEQLFRF